MTNLLGPGAFGAARPAASRPALTPSNTGSDDWYQDCTSPTARDGTEIDAAALNIMLALHRRSIRGGLIPEDNADDEMLARAIRGGRAQFVTFGGTTNAWTVVRSPASVAGEIGAGTVLVGLAPYSVTGAMTLVVDGGAAVYVRWHDGTIPATGDILAAQMVALRHDGTGWRLLEGLSPTQIKALANPVNLSVVVFDTSGSWTVPAGVKFALLEAWGGGGGGGGGDGTTYAGYGGGGGLYASRYTAVNPGDVHAITIGTGGNTSTTNGNSGIAGGSTSIGSLLTAGGGGGGGHAASSPGVGGSISAGAQVTIPGGGAFVRQMDGIGTPGGNAPRGSQGGQQGNSGQQPGGGAAGNSYNNAYSGQKGGNGRAIITFAA